MDAGGLHVVSLACLAVLACSPPPAGKYVPPDGGIVTAGGPFLAAGASHTCAIFGAGAVECWGDNTQGQLGRPPLGDPLADYSVDLGVGRRATAIYAGGEFTCVILDGGAVKCWGRNDFGQLGLGDMANRGDGTSAMGDGLPVVDLGTGERAVALALGETASCALLAGGRVKCWGDPYQGATGHGDIEPRGGSPGTMGDALTAADLGSHDGVRLKVQTVAAFGYHSFCAILEGAGPDVSALKCWGSNDYCELGIGLNDGGRGASPDSLGDNLEWIDIGTTSSGTVRKAVAMAAGFQSICALGDDGVVKCWGSNRSGEAGIGMLTDPRSCSPDEVGNAGLVPLTHPATAVGAGFEHACALLATGVTCWGRNTEGQLGTGDTMNRLGPSDPIVFGDGFAPADLVFGNDHDCAISTDGRAKCWGSNALGQLGPPATGDLLAPGPDLRLRGAPVGALAAGSDHTCAIFAGGAVKCWGRNTEGQLGVGDTTDRGALSGQMGDALPAVDLGAGAVATAVAAGTAHTCAVLADGSARCWGAGDSGQLGQGAVGFSYTPAPPIDLPGAATAIAAGGDFSCALLADGRVLCFGAGARGQLGAGDTSPRSAPGPAVALSAKATAIVVGDHHACALLANHDLACWGANDAGQLGAGDTQDRSRPAAVGLASSGVVAAAAGGDATCVRLADDSVRCWGHNDRGQLGLGDATDRPAPPAQSIDLGTRQAASALTVGGAFACALLGTRQVKCWGDNQLYELGALVRAPAYGDGPNEMGDDLAAAVQGGGRSVRAVAAGRAHVCAVLDTSDVRCWGDNSHGQLGAGDTGAHTPFLNTPGVVDLGRAP